MIVWVSSLHSQDGSAPPPVLPAPLQKINLWDSSFGVSRSLEHIRGSNIQKHILGPTAKHHVVAVPYL